MKVLSIDWDYFVEADAGFRAWNFPDGNQNLSEEISKIIWEGYYRTGELEKIGINEGEISLVRLKASTARKGGAGVNHDGILDLLPKRGKHTIYNIDFHHDCWSYDGKYVNCGNWLTKLVVDGRVNKIVWIHKPEKVLDFDDGKEEGIDERVTPFLEEKTDLVKALMGVKFDFMYFCLSPSWSPPHLDKKFIEHFGHMAPKLFTDRWIGMPDRIAQRINDYKELEKQANLLGVKILI